MADIQSTVEYRDIPGFPGYRVGDDGTVWSSWITCRWGRKRTERWKQMSAGTHSKGYLYVNLTPLGEKYRTLRVHRLVLEAFVGPCPDGMECRHLNGCKTDNRLLNIAWGTREENRDDCRKHDSYRKGERHQMSKLNDADVRSIRSQYAAGIVLMRELATEFNVTITNIHAIISRRSWSHLD